MRAALILALTLLVAFGGALADMKVKTEGTQTTFKGSHSRSMVYIGDNDWDDWEEWDDIYIDVSDIPDIPDIPYIAADHHFDYDYDFDFNFDHLKGLKNRKYRHYRKGSDIYYGLNRHVDIDIDGSTIFFTSDYSDDEVEITDQYEIYLNGDRLKLTPGQQRLTEDCYETMFGILDNAGEIGLKGARVGLAGAKLGANAILKLLKVLGPGYDMDDFEREIEREADKIEARADLIERDAEVIEDMADDLENMMDRLFIEVPELAALDWY